MIFEKDLFNTIEAVVNSTDSDEEAIEKLKRGDVFDDLFARTMILDIYPLYKQRYWSRTAKFIRWMKGENDDEMYNLMVKHLVSSGHYESVRDVLKKVLDFKQDIKDIGKKTGYQDTHYLESNEMRKRVISLIHLHLSDFPEELQRKAVKLVGQEKLVEGANSRTKDIHKLLDDMGK